MERNIVGKEQVQIKTSRIFDGCYVFKQHGEKNQ